jgi:hypothetical protein
MIAAGCGDIFLCNTMLKRTRIKIDKAKAKFTGRCPQTHPSRAPRRQFFFKSTVENRNIIHKLHVVLFLA